MPYFLRNAHHPRDQSEDTTHPLRLIDGEGHKHAIKREGLLCNFIEKTKTLLINKGHQVGRRRAKYEDNLDYLEQLEKEERTDSWQFRQTAKGKKRR